MQWWLEGGLFMYLVTGTAVLVTLGVGLAFLASVGAWFWRPLRPVSRVVGVLAVLATLTPLLIGMVGWFYNRTVVEAAVANVEPSQIAVIRALGMAEARHPMDLGSGLTCALLVPAALGALIALSVPSGPSEEDER